MITKLSLLLMDFVSEIKPFRGAALDNDLTNLTENVYPNATPNPNDRLNPSEPGVTFGRERVDQTDPREPGVAYPTGSKLRAEKGGQNQKSFAECRAPTPNQHPLSENQNFLISRFSVKPFRWALWLTRSPFRVRMTPLRPVMLCRLKL